VTKGGGVGKVAPLVLEGARCPEDEKVEKAELAL
jgi:hypothetical protein